MHPWPWANPSFSPATGKHNCQRYSNPMFRGHEKLCSCRSPTIFWPSKQSSMIKPGVNRLKKGTGSILIQPGPRPNGQYLLSSIDSIEIHKGLKQNLLSAWSSFPFAQHLSIFIPSCLALLITPLLSANLLPSLTLPVLPMGNSSQWHLTHLI